MSIFGDVWGGITGAARSVGGALGGLAEQAAPGLGRAIATGIAGGISQRIAGTGGGPIGTGGYPGGTTVGRMQGYPAPVVRSGYTPVSTGGGQMAGFPIVGGPQAGAQFQYASTGPLVVQQPGTGMLGMDPDVPSFFEPTKTTVRPVSLLAAVNPINGKMAFWEYAGRPVLFSRDLRVCKRVAKIAARAGRGRARRRGRKR